MAPQGMALIVRVVAPARRAAALAALAAAGTSAMAVGPLLGGALTSCLGWRSVFLVNVAIGAAALIAARRAIPASPLPAGHRQAPDVLGALLIMLGLAAIVFALQNNNAYHWSTPAGGVTVGDAHIGVAGVVVLACFVMWQRFSRREPLVPLQMFASRGFTMACLAAAAVGAASVGLLLPLAMYLQATMHYSPLAAGAVTAPMFVASALCSHTAPAATSHRKLLTIAALIVLACGAAFLLVALCMHSGLWTLIPALVVCGIGMGAGAAPMAHFAMSAVESHRAGAASGIYNGGRQIGGAIGAAVTGALIKAYPPDQGDFAMRAATGFTTILLVLAVLFCAVLPSSDHIKRRTSRRSM